MTGATRLLDHWLAPDGAGLPVACVATSYTFDADFFTQDCLNRFLQLSSLPGEGDKFDDLALLLEEEDRLSETRVVVLADRSCNPEARNLRWDLLPIAVPGGLLHAKVAVLVWERALRILVGSANLTPAGYRQQVEAVAAFDLSDDVATPRALFDGVLDEIDDLLELAPGEPDEEGPRRRAAEAVAIARERAAAFSPPDHLGTVRVAVAPSRPGHSPIQHLAEVWSGSRPRWATAISPFWDKQPEAAVLAIVDELVARAAADDRPEVWFVVPVQQMSEELAVSVPRGILDAVPPRIEPYLQEFPQISNEPRLLHAKVLAYESREWIAVMIGSSNMTAAGLGLSPNHGHRELNVWFGCRADAPEADQLRALVVYGEPLDPDAITEWNDGVDEDEIEHPAPPGIIGLLVIPGATLTLDVEVEADRLPDQWSLAQPTGEVIATQADWEKAGRPTRYRVPLAGAVLPQFVVATWGVSGDEQSSAYPVNVADPTALPPVTELRDLPAEVLLNILASTRPLHRAVAHELRRQAGEGGPTPGSGEVLDALKRFDNSRLLLQRTRHVSAALWGLEQRLARPAVSLEALEWRLSGAVGPNALAERLIAEADEKRLLPGEARFIIAELALTVSRVDWPIVGRQLERTAVERLVHATLARLRDLAAKLDGSGLGALDDYVDEAFAEVTQ